MYLFVRLSCQPFPCCLFRCRPGLLCVPSRVNLPFTFPRPTFLFPCAHHLIVFLHFSSLLLVALPACILVTNITHLILFIYRGPADTLTPHNQPTSPPLETYHPHLTLLMFFWLLLFVPSSLIRRAILSITTPSSVVFVLICFQ